MHNGGWGAQQWRTCGKGLRTQRTKPDALEIPSQCGRPGVLWRVSSRSRAQEVGSGCERKIATVTAASGDAINQEEDVKAGTCAALSLDLFISRLPSGRHHPPGGQSKPLVNPLQRDHCTHTRRCVSQVVLYCWDYHPSQPSPFRRLSSHHLSRLRQLSLSSGFELSCKRAYHPCWN